MSELWIEGATAFELIDRMDGLPEEMQVYTEDGGVVVVSDTLTQEELEAAVPEFVPEGEMWRGQLPEKMRLHAGHLRDFEQAVRNGTPVTNQQTLHVIADIIGYIRLTEDRL